MLRRDAEGIPDGSVVDELLAAYLMEDPVDFPTVGRYTIAAVADLNGDGVMEVMIRERFWESGGMSVYALDGGRLVLVGGGGSLCGCCHGRSALSSMISSVVANVSIFPCSTKDLEGLCGIWRF